MALQRLRDELIDGKIADFSPPEIEVLKYIVLHHRADRRSLIENAYAGSVAEIVDPACNKLVSRGLVSFDSATYTFTPVSEWLDRLEALFMAPADNPPAPAFAGKVQ